MAQLVPCSAAYPQPMPPMQLADFAQPHNTNCGLLEVPYGGGQTVPSSPTFSTWNYSPPSYWSDYNRSPQPMVIKNEPCHQADEAVASDSSLEELLDDYTFDYYNNNEKEEKPIKQEEQQASSSQGHALLRQCLRPAADDYQQRCHLQFLNQIGSVIASQPQLEMSVKTEKQAAYWNGTNNPNPAQGLASVLSLVMETVNEEVRSTCEILGVSPSKSFLFCFFCHPSRAQCVVSLRKYVNGRPRESSGAFDVKDQCKTHTGRAKVPYIPRPQNRLPIFSCGNPLARNKRWPKGKVNQMQPTLLFWLNSCCVCVSLFLNNSSGKICPSDFSFLLPTLDENWFSSTCPRFRNCSWLNIFRLKNRPAVTCPRLCGLTRSQGLPVFLFLQMGKKRI